MNRFMKYTSTGVCNTGLHWIIFLFLYSSLGFGQALSNIIAFFFACSFSFIVNAYWTFESSISWFRYLCWVSIMGGIAYITGFFVECLNWHPLATLILFSVISLLVGYLSAKTIVFTSRAE